jgi:hypothetical protein
MTMRQRSFDDYQPAIFFENHVSVIQGRFVVSRTTTGGANGK